MNLAEFAGLARACAERASAGLAIEACRRGTREYLAVLQTVTPVRGGALRASEAVRAISGSGAYAIALAGPNIIYDKIQNDGGTITKHSPGSLGTPAVGFFGHSVTLKGQHYMEKAAAEFRPLFDAVCQIVADEYIRL